MSKYYKDKFSQISKSWQKKRAKKQKVEDMNSLIAKFVRNEFYYLNTGIHTLSIDDLIPPMTVILHSHRYKKKETFVENIDFSIIRDLLYSFSDEVLSKFLRNKQYAFILHNFYVKGADEFLKKAKEQDWPEFNTKLTNEFETLNKAAIKKFSS